MSPILLIGAGVVILGIGLAIGYGFAQRQRIREASDLQAELDKYRGEVTEHFSQTAEHFQALGRQYQALYRHMAAGSEALCDTSQVGGRLAFPRPADDTAVVEEQPRTVKDYAVEDPVEADTHSVAETEVIAEAAAEEAAPADADETDGTEELLTEPAPAAETPDTERIVH